METMLKIKAGIMRVLSIVIIFLFAFMTVIGTYQIVTRYFFNKPSTVFIQLYMDGSSCFCLCVWKERPHENGLFSR